MHFGYPYCHGGDLADPKFGEQRACEEFTPPAQKLGPHVAPLGLRFYTGEMFPAEYRNQLFMYPVDAGKNAPFPDVSEVDQHVYA